MPNRWQMIEAVTGEALAHIAVQAGAIVMQHFDDGCAVESKADASPVTAADREAEALILRELARIAPDIPVLAEEAVSAGARPELGDLFFCVDPLDGTREFVEKRNEFTVNIALVAEGVPVMGVVYAPALGQLFVAEGPAHSWAGFAEPGEPLPAHRQTITVRDVPESGLIAIASRSHGTPETEVFLDSLSIAERQMRGSSLKFCCIAEGKADIYPRFGRTMEWDTAAGDAVLRGAGGKVLTTDGEPLRYGKAERDYDNPNFIAYGDVDPVILP